MKKEKKKIEEATSKASNARRFILQRNEDETGVSGEGVVAEGVEFSDGTCVLKWLTALSSIGIYDSLKEVLALHGHSGKTEAIFTDAEG
jgi:hypothetical protein